MKKFAFFVFNISLAIIISIGCLTKELTPEEKAAEEKANSQLPFAVEVDGNSAEIHSTIAALIEEPVEADAEIVCDTINNDIINITFFPCDSNGIVVPGKKPALIIIREGNKTTLDKTVNGEKLISGFYLMDVSNGKQTSRAVLEVK